MSGREVNKPIKKHILWTLIAVLIIAVSVLVVKLAIRYLPIMIFHHASTWKLCADYEQYEINFNLVKDYISTEFPNESDKYIIVSYNKETGNGLYDPDTMEHLTLPDNVASALTIICRNGFPDKDSTLVVIRIQEERISFCTMNGYALVFSPERKPTGLNSPYKNSRVKVKKIQDGWYHVEKKN